MNIIIVVCLYDRHENLRRWLHAWNLCDKTDTTLYIVNNKYQGLDIMFWYDYCKKRNAKYLQRKNVGFETGVIQDAFLGKIGGDWDYMIFVTDDTIPMKKDFVQQYMNKATEPDMGVVYMEASNVTAPHIRTTGFCISRETAKNITFPRGNSQVTSKGDCYHFEHKGGEEIFLKQIMNMGKNTAQVASLEQSVLWDTHTTNFNRWDEWHKEFPGYEG